MPYYVIIQILKTMYIHHQLCVVIINYPDFDLFEISTIFNLKCTM